MQYKDNHQVELWQGVEVGMEDPNTFSPNFFFNNSKYFKIFPNVTEFNLTNYLR